jgi:hypothetical protein
MMQHQHLLNLKISFYFLFLINSCIFKFNKDLIRIKSSRFPLDVKFGYRKTIFEMVKFRQEKNQKNFEIRNKI